MKSEEMEAKEIGFEDITGTCNEAGNAVTWPKRYATGALFTRQKGQPLTTCRIGTSLFYLLPIGVGALPPEERDTIVAWAEGQEKAVSVRKPAAGKKHDA